MKSKPLVSLCMPTNGVIEWVIPVLNSIYDTNVDNDSFEVIVTDNGMNDKFKEEMLSLQEKHPNLVYLNTEAPLFLNEIEAYKHANGLLIKFVNHRTLLLKGFLENLIIICKKYCDKKPIIYFSNGALDISKTSHEYDTFDDFVKNLSILSSWSTGMTIWKEDFDRIPRELESFNELFPHTNVLFNERHRCKYIINNEVVMSELQVGHKSKGKYDLYYAFGVEYPSIIERLLIDGDISKDTFNYVLDKTLEFIGCLYWDFNIRGKDCSYVTDNIKCIFSKHYSLYGFIKKIIGVIIEKNTRSIRRNR